MLKRAKNYYLHAIVFFSYEGLKFKNTSYFGGKSCCLIVLAGRSSGSPVRKKIEQFFGPRSRQFQKAFLQTFFFEKKENLSKYIENRSRYYNVSHRNLRISNLQ